MKKLAVLIILFLVSAFVIADEEETAVVKTVSRAGTVTLVGNLLPDKDVMMDNEVGGLVENVHVDTGDIVKKGDLLITLSSVMIDATLVSMKNSYDGLVFGFKDYKPYFAKQAAADSNQLFLGMKQAATALAYQKKELNRLKKLLDKGAVTESEFDRMKMASDQAEIAMQQASTAVVKQHLTIENLRRDIAVVEHQAELLKIKAPFSGRVVDVYTEVGEKVPGDPGGNFIRIVDDSTVVFRAGVPEEYYGLVKKGSSVSLKVPGKDKLMDLKVSRISPIVDAAGRTFDVEIEIDNSTGMLKPGLFCRAELSILRKGLAVDSSFILMGEKGDFVKLKDGTEVKVTIVSSPKQGEVFISGKGIRDGTELLK